MQISAAALWLNTVFADLDLSITLLIHKLYEIGGGFFSPFFEFISFFGKGGICLIILSLALMFFKKTRRFGTAMLMGVAIGAIFTNLFLKIVIARPRPYTFDEYKQLWAMVGQHMESDKSFPSGHTTAAFATMTPVFLVGRKRISWTAFIFAFLMGVSRIYLVVHYPTDVFGGIIVGFVAGCIGTLCSRRLPESWYEMDFGKKKHEPRHLEK